MTKITETSDTKKLTIKTNVIEKVTKEVDKELDLPYYCKNGDHYLKVISQLQAVSVDPSNSWTRILITSVSSFTDNIAEGTPCTEEDFNTAFQTALSKIQNIIL